MCIYIHIHVCTYIYIHIHTCIHIYIHIYMWVYIYIYIYIYMYTHLHLYIYIHDCICEHKSVPYTIHWYNWRNTYKRVTHWPQIAKKKYDRNHAHTKETYTHVKETHKFAKKTQMYMQKILLIHICEWGKYNTNISSVP